MVGRVVEVATDGRYLSVDRGFLVVAERQTEIGRVPLDEMAALIANAHGLTLSNNLLVRLAERGIPVVLCGANHMPAAIVWPVDGHHAQTGRMADQMGAALPLKSGSGHSSCAPKSWPRVRCSPRSARPRADFACCRARPGRAIRRMSKPKRPGAIGCCCSAPISVATEIAEGPTPCSITATRYCAPGSPARSSPPGCIPDSASCIRIARTRWFWSMI